MIIVKGEKYFVEKELAIRYGLSVHWFRRARYMGDGPIYHKLNGKVYYLESNADEWFSENLIMHKKATQ